MNIQATIIPIQCDKVYSGEGKNGLYTIGTWRVKGVLDGKLFMVTAFTNEHEILNSNINCPLNCEIDIFCESYKDTMYNKMNIKNPVNKEKVNDLPSSQSEAPVQQQNTSVNPQGSPFNVLEGGSDLPF